MVDLDREKLRNVRKKNALTQEQLAEKTELSDRYIRKIENGTAIPAVTVMYTICRVYRQPIEAFIIEKEEGEMRLAENT